VKVKSLRFPRTLQIPYKGGRIYDVIIDISKAFDLVPYDRLLRKLQPRSGSEGRCLDEKIPAVTYTKI
jgi:hypothetical protein